MSHQPGDLNSGPGSHRKVEVESRLHKVVLTFVHIHETPYSHHINTHYIILKK